MAGKPGFCDEELLQLIQLIYRAAEDSKIWSALLERMVPLFSATAGTLDSYDYSQKSGNITASYNVDPAFMRGYTEHYASKNLWLNYRPDSIPANMAVTGQMLVPDDVFIRSEFYQDYLRQGNVFHLLGGRIEEAKKQSAFVSVSLFRPRNEGPFGEMEVAFFDRLLPHLQQSLKLHQRIAQAAALQSAAADALDRIPIGVLVVDACARVLSANRRATEILGAHHGISSGTEGLRAAVPSQTASLRKLIAAAAATARGQGLHPGGALSVERPSLKPPLGVRVIPLTRRTCLSEEPRAAAIVFVSDPELPPTVSHLVALFQLTPAEERLAVQLAEGQTLEQAAEALHVSRNTAATQLKSVFQKTGTRRQAELIRLFVGSVATLAL